MDIKRYGDFINESLLLEFKMDMMPKCVIVMGGPAAGKTWWMNNAAPLFFKKNFTNYKKLDSDHNLVQFQKEHENEICDDIIRYLSANASNASDGVRKKSFTDYIKNKQKQMDKICVANHSPKIDLSEIDYKYCKAWVDRYDNAKDIPTKEKVTAEFKKDFDEKYFVKLFASDFSVRPDAKEVYKSTFDAKLSGMIKNDANEIGDEEAFISDLNISGTSDVCVAITGDKLKKIQEVCDVSNGSHAIYVIYLDIPEEMSIAADEERKRISGRGVGAEMIKEKLANIHKTWDQLLSNYESMGIWKMFRLSTPISDKHAQWYVAEEHINKKLIKIN